ncbi:uncharacterized protein RHOBADRAFT_53347 [Rhodotorula graminis WP1]|uniref:PX domain-containing protein n=1 Tax=Rhodotorula graminis (strain WP1) TaxID=578459 RepID=A0A194S447_RHOGW|nr:uncharacterized protein RHOBADRAFT_53347 [Rhodotorula graminis WP1]KPV75362.1 hypothetical protein RHOBADRAFT_53347 [Rhodotorula graminis WP1]
MPFHAPLASQDRAVLARAHPPPPSARSPPTAAAPSPSTSSAPPPGPRTTATLRLPAPPPPPKPLYLSTRRGRTRPAGLGAAGDDDDGAGEGGIRERGYEGPATRSSRGQRGALPRWSVAEEEPAAVGQRDEREEDDGEDEAGTVKGGAQVSGQEDQGERMEKREARAALEALFAPAPTAPSAPSPTRLDPPAAAREPSSASTASSTFSDAYRTPVGTLKARGAASTLRFRGRSPGRVSIYFDTAQENPFARPPSPPSPPALEGAPGDAAAAPLLELPLGPAQPALALHAFAGETAFGELSFAQGAVLRIEVEDVGGGWSLGWREEEGDEGRGLVPRGWYAYVDGEQPASPPGPAERSVPSLDENSASSSAAVTSPLADRPVLDVDVAPPAVVDSADQPSSPSSALADLTLSSLSSPASPSPLTSPVAIASSPASPSSPTPSSFARSAAPSPTTPARPADAHSSSRARSSSSPSRSPTSPTSATARTPYATRSIGRHLVVSGTEFEPTWGEGAAALAAAEGATAGDEQRREGSGGGVTGAAAAADEAQGHGENALEPLESVEESPRSALDAEPALVASSPSVDDEGLERSEPAAPAATVESSALSPGRPVSPIPLSRPPPPTGSFLFRLGLVPAATAATSSAISLFLPALGRTPIPGASILAATAATPSPEHARRVPLPRLTSTRRATAPSAAEGKALLLRWVDEGDALDDDGLDAATQRWDVESGPAWRSSPHESYGVTLREARKVSPLGEAAYVVFEVETMFPSAAATASGDEGEPGSLAGSNTTLVVHRRYSHFLALHTLLSARYCAPLVVVPSLPPGAPLAYGAARFDPALVETRRRELEAWLRRCGRHAVLGTCEEMRGFLALEGDKELAQHLLLSPTSPPTPPLPLFPARVFHPPFNLDLGDAAELVDRFEAHCRAVETGGGWRAVEEAVRKGREGERGAANDLQRLADSLVRLAAGIALPPTSLDKLLPAAHSPIYDEGMTDVQQQQQRARAWGVQNEVGALSWREDDDGALGMSKAVQTAAEAIDNVADGLDLTVREELLEVEALLHDEVNPLSQYSALIDLHRTLLSQYTRLSRLSTSDPDHALEPLGRCETLLNITSAEMARIADERTEVLTDAVKSWLEAQARQHEQALAHLSYAASHFLPESLADLALTGPRLRSRLEARATPRKYSPLLVAGVYGQAGTSAG